MRSFMFTLSLVLLFFVVSCNSNDQITQPQNSSVLTMQRSAVTHAIGDSVVFTFDTLKYDVDYPTWQGLTFFYPNNGGPTVITGSNGYWSDRNPIGITFPETNYNKVSVDLTCSDMITMVVNYTDGTSTTGDADSPTTVTAPCEKYISSIEISSNRGDNFVVHTIILYLVDNPCVFPPKVTLDASRPTIWPANNKETEVTFSGNIKNLDGITTYQLTDEYGIYTYSGTIESGDYSIPLNLMASRKGNDIDGRKYTFMVTAENESGKVVKSVDVVVLHDQRK